MKQPLSITMTGPERDLRPEGVSLYSFALAFGLMLFSGPLWAQPRPGESFRTVLPVPPQIQNPVEPARPATQRDNDTCCRQPTAPPILSETHPGMPSRTSYTSTGISTSTSTSMSTSTYTSTYSPPPGFHYQAWAVGSVLPRVYWGRGYWIDNYWLFALKAPPWECVWVRYGNDAMLVNRRNGAILQILRHKFR
ncbi:Ni/Co efflux regulator RcnB [Novosphingobium sp. SG751A]|uniref:RcnB family protein n=1 Tax=Novosphingobium sp. SG751A TaxID=2587000 RepID=UPI0015559351|nr:RcnB family protein [Novosphingobium sp. SG751A]NOW48267.1 Ni/Co efflux regulator RcnB [Novosphingobium sp. SG751A]